MDDFKILSYEEEIELSLEEKKIYYIMLKEYLANLKYSSSKSRHLNTCEKLNKSFIRTIIDVIKGYDLIVENQNLIPSSPVIFASTHQDFNDHFNIVLSIPYHTIILNSSNVPSIVKIMMNRNGIEYVNRDNSQSKFASKIGLMEYLAKGKSVVVFPEATFNCSPNKLVLPIHGGVIDMARKMQVPIVPLVQEYTFDTLKMDGKDKVISCTVRFGNPIYVSFDDNKYVKKQELRDSMASIRFDLIKEKGLFDRKSISNKEYISFLLSRLHTMKLMRVNYDDEIESIYGSKDQFYEFFPINAVPYNEKGELLQEGPVRKLEFLK